MRAPFWAGTARVLGLRPVVALLAVATTLMLVLQDSLLTLPGTPEPVLLARVAPALLTLLSVPLLTEPWRAWEAVGARSPMVLRSARWLVGLTATALPALAVSRTTDIEATLPLTLVPWALSVVALAANSRAWWLVPLAGMYAALYHDEYAASRVVVLAVPLLLLASWAAHVRWGAGLSARRAG